MNLRNQPELSDPASDHLIEREAPEPRSAVPTWRTRTPRVCLVLGAFLLLLAGASAYANRVGAIVAPYSGSQVKFLGNVSSVNINFQGTRRIGAGNVQIWMGKIGTSGGGFPCTQVADTCFRAIKTVQSGEFSGNNFNVTVPVTRNGGGSVTYWNNDDAVAFRAVEMVNGAWSFMSAYTIQGFEPREDVIAISDKPDSNKFPSATGSSQTLPLAPGVFFSPPPTNPFPNEVASSFLKLKGLGSNTDANNYYAALPTSEKYADGFLLGAPITGFDLFRLTNGFTDFPQADHVPACAASTTNETCAFYRNEADLGFGRAMHCRIVAAGILPTKIACYVTNYANEGDAYNNHGTIATVAMTWNSANTNKDYVTFDIFDSGGHRINAAPLDGTGAKNLPTLCMNCHGGSLDGANRVLGAHFLPFDQDALPTAPQFPNQAARFRTLNNWVWFTEVVNVSTPPSGGSNLQNLINTTWYGGNMSGGTFNGAGVPAGWASHEALYLGVVAPYCRTCHIAQSSPAVQFSTYLDFINDAANIKNFACTKPGAINMPHAQRTYHRFWEGGAPALLANEIGAVSDQNACAFKPL